MPKPKETESQILEREKNSINEGNLNFWMYISIQWYDK